jgi:hypothetical protein
MYGLTAFLDGTIGTNERREGARRMAESPLEARFIRQEGFVDEPRVTEIWRAHIAGKGNWQQYLWTVLVFQARAEASAGSSLSTVTA